MSPSQDLAQMDDQQLREALRPGESPAADAAKGTKEMVTTEQMVEGNDDSGVEFEPITTDSGMTLKTDREAQLWRDGFEEVANQEQIVQPMKRTTTKTMS